MPRVPDLAVDELDEEQRAAYAEIATSRGGVARGPFSVWLHNPQVALAASRFGDALRLHGHLERSLFEIITLVVAARWKASYPWVTHEPVALRLGITPVVIAAIHLGRTPVFERDAERIVHDVGVELLDTGTLEAATYQRAVAALGVQALVEVVTTYGWYTAAALVANAFEVEVPGGGKPFTSQEEK